MSVYLRILIFCGAVPFIFSFWPSLHFWKYRMPLGKTLGTVMCVFLVWDMYATWRGHWDFNPAMVLPLRLGNLPLEEVLFFAVIPFCAIFTWEVLRYFLGRRR